MSEVAPRHGRYRITLNGSEFGVNDRLVKGRDLLELAGLNPVDEHVLFFREPDGMVEDINLGEDVDLSAPGKEEFLAFKADRLFFLVIDGRRFPWGSDTVTGKELRSLGRVADAKDLYFDPKGGRDDLVELDEAVSLKGKEVEHFYTVDRPTGPVPVTVELNGEKVEILSGDYTTETLKEALGVPADWDIDIVDKLGSFRTLKPGEPIKVIAKLKFVSHVRQGGSS